LALPSPLPSQAADDAPDEPRLPPIFLADAQTSARIVGMTPAERAGALCAIEARADPAITFGLLDRSPDRFVGHLWAFTGRAIQIQDIPGEQGSFILVALDSWANNIVALFTHARPPDNIVANRRVRAYGRIAGSFSYEQRNGGSRTVPKLFTVAVVRSEEAPRCPARRP
jgi:hypothetical protein